jgi:hypothetical protein
MESKTARLTVLVDPDKKKAFERLCASQDLTPSQVVRHLIRGYLAEHGVSYGPAAGGDTVPQGAEPAQAARPTPGPVRR